MSKNQVFLDDIEQAVSDFVAGRLNVGALEKRIAKDLSNCRFLGRTNTFTVCVVKNTRSKEPFFGARIYPAIDYLQNIVENTVADANPFKELQEAWGNINSWVIEIDSSMLDRDLLSLTPKEFVAALLHEIGHTIYSTKVIERFYRCYRSMRVHLNCAEKDSMRAAYTLFMIPLSVSCSIRSWTRGRNGIKEEFFADNVTKTEGYGDFYVSLLSKIISAYGSSICDESETISDNKVSERMRWATLNISDETRRHNKLANDLYMESAKTPSQYMKALSAKVLNLVGIGMKERYTGDAVESATMIGMIMGDKPIDFSNVRYGMSFDYSSKEWLHFNDAIESALRNPKYVVGTPANEAFMKKKIRTGLPSWMDIDHIQIEVDRINNHQDRSFALEMIYNKIDDINEFMDSIKGNQRLREKYEVEAQRMLKRLEELREAILRRNNFSSKYEVFVKYPAGYEG